MTWDRPLSEIIPGRLWQSGCPVPLEKVLAKGINTIVTVGHQAQPWLREWDEKVFEGFRGPEQPKQPAMIHVPLFDASNCIDPAAHDAVVTAALVFLRDPWRKLLVHCDAGAFRSVSVSAAIVAVLEDCDSATAFVATDRRTGVVANPRKTLGMHGWREHEATWNRPELRRFLGLASRRRNRP